MHGNTVIITVTDLSRERDHGDWEEPKRTHANSSIYWFTTKHLEFFLHTKYSCVLHCLRTIATSLLTTVKRTIATSHVAHEPIENTTEAGPTLTLDQALSETTLSSQAWCCSSTESDHAWELLPGPTGQTQVAKPWLQ